MQTNNRTRGGALLGGESRIDDQRDEGGMNHYAIGSVLRSPVGPHYRRLRLLTSPRPDSLRTRWPRDSAAAWPRDFAERLTANDGDPPIRFVSKEEQTLQRVRVQ